MFKKLIGVMILGGLCALPASMAAEQTVKNAADTPSSQYIPVNVAGVEYFYRSGVFYTRSGNNYIATASPAGAVIQSLPQDNTVVMIKKKTYYYSSSTYYTAVDGGYMVVASPFATQPVQQPPAVTQNTAPSAPAAQSSGSTSSSTTTTTTTTMPAVMYPSVVTVAPPPPVPVVRNPDSQNPIKKFARGVFCTVFGFMEIPINMAEIGRKEGPPQAMSYGFFKGVGFFILREVVGCVEVATFIIPLPGTVENGVRDWGYGPLLEPEWIFPNR